MKILQKMMFLIKFLNFLQFSIFGKILALISLRLSLELLNRFEHLAVRNQISFYIIILIHLVIALVFFNWLHHVENSSKCWLWFRLHFHALPNYSKSSWRNFTGGALRVIAFSISYALVRGKKLNFEWKSFRKWCF